MGGTTRSAVMAARTRPARVEAFAICEPIPARAGSDAAVIASANADATSAFIGVLRAAGPQFLLLRLRGSIVPCARPV